MRIARSLLLARWRQTSVAAAGVTFGITMFIALLSFMMGLNEMLDDMILSRTPHIRLYNEVRPNAHQPINSSKSFSKSYNFIRSVKPGSSRQEIYNSRAVLQTLRRDPRIKGVAPKITAQVFFNDGPVDITGVITGIDVAEEDKVFRFNEYIVEGKPSDLNDVSNSIILGKSLAHKLLAQVGDVVYVTTAQRHAFSLKIVGIYQSGIEELDKVQSYTSLATAQKIWNQPGDYITDIHIRLHDLKKSAQLSTEFSALFNTDAEDILTSNSQFETGSFIRSLISYAVGVTLLVVAGFGIYNILNMLIYEKMDSIAILKATGFAGRDVNRIFMTIALSIGLVGGSLGLIFGFLLSYGIDHIPFNTASLPTLKTYPVSYNPAFYCIGASFSLITTYLSGWAPARKASKIDPVVIIRGK
nr:ABC transporter permease [Chryseolinea lacunae]